MSHNPNRYGAPPPESLRTVTRRIECPVLFAALEIIGVLFVAAVFYLAWIVL